MNKTGIINFFEDPTQYIKTVKKEWERFIGTGNIQGLAVRKEILQSWELSFKNGISQSQSGAKLVLDNESLNKVLLKNATLISVAQPILDEFTTIMKSGGKIGNVINLSNADTVVLKTITSDSTAEQAAGEHHLLPGAILSEQYSGTTGVAMARNTLQPYAVYGQEHFTFIAKDWSCAAAPIKNVSTRELMGILSMTGNNFSISTDTMGMITFVARTIENAIYNKFLYNSKVLEKKFHEVQLRSKADIIIALDCDNTVVSSSKYEHPVLLNCYSHQKLRNDVEVLTNKAIYYLRQAPEPVSQPLKSFCTHDYSFSISPVYYDKGLTGLILYGYSTKQTSQKHTTATKKYITQIVNTPTLIGDNPAFVEAIETAKKAANTEAPVMLLGETGVGKEGFARTIYLHSNRADRPFVTVNCGAIPKELIGSELFGYEPGAFTGALPKGKIGKIEAANGGTIFLDELGELPLDSQTYLLRVLEEKELFRLGSNHPISIDVRIIAATNADLRELIERKKFRLDLYYRLSVIEIKIPPLRKRLDDLPNLISYFNSLYSGDGCVLNDDDLFDLTKYSWPGNIRELRNAVQSANILGKDTVQSLRDYVKANNQHNIRNELSMMVVNKSEPNESIDEIIKACNGNISKAAKLLGVARSTIYRRLKKQ